ncbi:MAG: hypothetical protein WDM77_09890 [Steroidobacteraceae bacterium]
MNERTRMYMLLAGLAAAAGLAWWYFSNQDTGESDDTVASAGGVVGSIVNALTPRGIRNNNPATSASARMPGRARFRRTRTALLSSSKAWADGIRAIAKTLLTYADSYDINTVRGFITRWSATDQDAYVANVSSDLGVQPDDPIDITDPDTMASMINGIITQENGVIVATLVSANDIQTGIQEAA